MKHFISGATSSIGRALVQNCLRHGDEPVVLVRDLEKAKKLITGEVRFVEGSINDQAALEKGVAGCDAVTNLAAVMAGSKNDPAWWDTNLHGTEAILRAAETAGVSSFVQVSSLSVRGATKPGEVGDETRPIMVSAHHNMYQKTKFAADNAVRERVARGLNAKIVYPGFGYGPFGAVSHSSMVDQTFLRMARGDQCAIMGNGRNVFGVSYIFDTAEGIRLCHERGQGGGEYILVNDDVSFVDIWREVSRILGRPMPDRFLSAGKLHVINLMARLKTGKDVFPADFIEMIRNDWNYGSAKARRELGWNPLSFAASMEETWAYLNNGSRAG